PRSNPVCWLPCSSVLLGGIRLGVLGLNLSRDVRLVVILRRLGLLRLSLCVGRLLRGGRRGRLGLAPGRPRGDLSLCRGSFGLCSGGLAALAVCCSRRGRLPRGNLAGLLLLLHLPECHGEPPDERAERAHEPTDGRGDDADELTVEHFARGQAG